MPTKEINAAITVLEERLKHYENLLDRSISNDEILSKTKVILRHLKKVAQELNDLKKIQSKK
jgi:hypothetical protein